MIDFAVFEDRALGLETAARNVAAACRNDAFGKGWRPKGLDEVAVVLESLGYSDEVVRELWYPSLFELARDVTRLLDKYVADEDPAAARQPDWFVQSVRDYAVGALYSGPWIIAVVALIVCGAALWSSLATPPRLATAIALGTFASLILSGAFAQAIGRRVSSYFWQNDLRLVDWVLRRLLGAAACAFGLAAFAGWLALRGFYGDGAATVAVGFFLGSGAFQLALAPLYALRRFGPIVAVATFAAGLTGATFVFAFHRAVALPWEPAVLAAEIGAVGIATLAATLYWLRRAAQRRGGRALPPSLRALARATLPYAAFGLLYFLAIVVDHIAAGLRDGFPYRYRAGYELGCDLALLCTVPIVGAINVAMEALPRRILGSSRARLETSGRVDAAMLRFFATAALGVVAAGVLAVALSEWLGPLVLAAGGLGAGVDRAEALAVLRIAAPAYGLVMLGLLASQLLFFLSRPRAPLCGAALGAACNGLVGALVVLDRLPVVWCAFGLLAGAAAFAFVAVAAALQAARDFTFAYYAAY